MKSDSLIQVIREPTEEKSADKKREETIRSLEKKIRVSGDFPAFSKLIADLSIMASNDDASCTDMTNIILKDYALTQKLLRLINSAMYSPYTNGGQITTVSKAVFILGFQQIRNVALSLNVFEKFANKSHASELKDSAISAFMSAFMARELAKKMPLVNHEEAFICSMFHNIGKHMIIYFFPDKHQEINHLINLKKHSEKVAARKVLGLSFEDLSAEVLKIFRFPDTILASAKNIPENKVRKTQLPSNNLRNLSVFSNELSNIAAMPDTADKKLTLEKLTNRFKKTLPVSEDQVTELLAVSTCEIERICEILNINLCDSRFARNILERVEPGNESTEVTDENLSGESNEPSRDKRLVLISQTQVEPAISLVPENNEQFFTLAIDEITNAISNEESLNNVLTMIMETMYRGFNFFNLIIFVRNHKKKKMEARFGLGPMFETARNFSFPFGNYSDIFNLSMIRSRDLIIEDVNAPSLNDKIPDWYHTRFAATAFLLYPIIVNKVPFGLFYANVKDPGELSQMKHQKCMNKLRNQAVFAISSAASK